MFTLFPAAMFVLLGGPQIWRPHSEPYKLLLHIFKKNSGTKNCTDVRLGQVVNLSIFYNIWNAWLQTFQGFYFSFRRRDSENHQFTSEPSRRETKNILKLIAHCRIQKHWNFITEDRQTFGVLRLIHIKFEFIWWPQSPCDFVSIDIHCVARKILKLSYISGIWQ